MSKTILNKFNKVEQQLSYDRLIKEIEELETRITGLSKFITKNEVFCCMTTEEQELMLEQVEVMTRLYFILTARKDKFKIHTIDEYFDLLSRMSGRIINEEISR